ncbi:MAG: DUF4198 domain-containing protein [Pseudolabrys sp.]
MVLLGAVGAPAHEFWLEPTTYTPKPGARVPVSIKIGERFKGNSYPFLHEDFKTFSVIHEQSTTPVKGIDGDDPAVIATFDRDGLTVMVHYSTPETLTFETWDKFNTYLQFEGLTDVVERHRRRGLPEAGVTEIYSRCAKLLAGVGSARGQDRFTGMPLELIAEKNPYQLAPGEPLPVKLLRDGKPAADVQIGAIPKAAPDDRLTVRTDGEGRAILALNRTGPWLLNAVVIDEPRHGEKAHWVSLWASMTFARP